MPSCSCGVWFKYTSYPNSKNEDSKLDSLCSACKNASNPAIGYLASHEFVQGSASSDPLPDYRD